MSEWKSHAATVDRCEGGYCSAGRWRGCVGCEGMDDPLPYILKGTFMITWVDSLSLDGMNCVGSSMREHATHPAGMV